jgi:VWFA-related protein
MEGVEGKKAIILLSTGLDTISKHSYSETLKKAGQSDSMIYTVSMAPFARPILDPYMEPAAQIRLLQAENVMRSFAEVTGGLSFFPRFPGDYPSVYEAVSAGMKNQYTLGYVSKNQKTGGRSGKLRVEVVNTDIDHDGKPDKLKVRHKRGY